MSQIALSFEDRQRLAKQTQAVWSVMGDGQWRTLSRIRDLLALEHRVPASEASISARLRELRSLGHQVDRRQVKDAPRGLNEYRVWGRE